MKIIQTFWSGHKPDEKTDLTEIKGGWLSGEYHWMSWAYSCLQLKKIFGEVELITDQKGKEILIDILKLPYTKVSIELEGIMDPYPKELWALCKIYSYSIQKEPFIHVDGDVFLWHTFEEKINNAELVSQNEEMNLFFYKEILDQVNEHFPFIPQAFAKERYTDKNFYSSNAGLFGGRNLNFIASYCQKAFEFVDKNIDHIDKVNRGQLNFIFEQYLLHQLAETEQVPITYFMDDLVDDPVFKDYIKFEDFPFIKIVHPVGGFKKMQHVGNHLAYQLRQDYPEYYYRIINKTQKEKAGIKSRVYNVPDFKINELTHSDTQLSPSGIETLNKDNFDLTHASIDYCNNTYLKDSSQKLSLQHVSGQNFGSISLDDSIIQRLSEIHNIETHKNEVRKNWFKNLNACQYYTEDALIFSEIQRVFALSIDEILNAKVSLRNYIEIHEHSWIWKFEHEDHLKLIAERNFNVEKQFGQIAFIPDILRLYVDEYYLDKLDSIIVNQVTHEKSIGAIITTMKDYFDPEEIEKNYTAFSNLIINSIKRISYAGVLKININT